MLNSMNLVLRISCLAPQYCIQFSFDIYFLEFQNSSFQALLPLVRQRIIDSFTPKALDLFQREFDFFDKVTSISGVLFPIPKEERRAGIRKYVPIFM